MRKENQVLLEAASTVARKLACNGLLLSADVIEDCAALKAIVGELNPQEWFGFYTQFFDTVEINNTFYQLPPATTFQAWHAQAPEGFLLPCS
jgi:hypothetical protein